VTVIRVPSRLEDRTMDSLFENIRQPEGIDGSFYHSLQELRKQLDDMNKRTSTLLRRNHKSSDSDAAILPSDTLQLPNGPAFWQLYRTLRTELRGVEARVELVEDRVETLSNRLDELEPPRFTPPSTPMSTAKSEVTVNNQPLLRKEESSPGVTQSFISANAKEMPDADISDIGYFDPSVDDTDENKDLETYDVITFFAKLKRASRTKRIVRPERFFRGTALHLYTLGYNNDGANMYDLEDGCLNISAFEEVLMSLFRPKALEAMKNETYTLTDFQNGRRLVEDYALKLLGFGRYLKSEDAAERIRLTYGMALHGINIDASLDIGSVEDDLPDTLPVFLARLAGIEVEIERALWNSGTARSPASAEGFSNDPTFSTVERNTQDRHGNKFFTTRLSPDPQLSVSEDSMARELSSTPAPLSHVQAWSNHSTRPTSLYQDEFLPSLSSTPPMEHNQPPYRVVPDTVTGGNVEHQQPGYQCSYLPMPRSISVTSNSGRTDQPSNLTQYRPCYLWPEPVSMTRPSFPLHPPSTRLAASGTQWQPGSHLNGTYMYPSPQPGIYHNEASAPLMRL